MRYLVLATDYDGTIAHHGRVSEPTVQALERLLKSGRKLVLVTGRQLDDLAAVCPQLDYFERVVAENGAVLYTPRTRERKVLAAGPPPRFVDALAARGVSPLAVGDVIVATWEPHSAAVLETIKSLGLELQVIFNKGAVMVLPASVNKATGLAAALDDLGLSPHNAVGIGDAQNDHAFLRLCECSAAVANALPAVMETADVVTKADHGDGVIELINEILADDLANHEHRLTRHHILLGTDANRNAVTMRPHGVDALIVGTSGSGKSAVATALLERLAEDRYSYCVVDPEGDYGTLDQAMVLGSADQPPNVEELLQLLESSDRGVVINLIGVPLADRPVYFQGLLPKLLELRLRTGRPHWLLIDEAHHLMPAGWEATDAAWPQRLDGLVRVTVHPNLVAPSALETVDTIIVVGQSPLNQLREFSTTIGIAPPDIEEVVLAKGQALVWQRDGAARPPLLIDLAPSRGERRRHRRKYAEGALGEDRSFYFRGPLNRLNLRAQNLVVFLQLADGVDDETWMHHLRRHDYSRWLDDCVKDSGIAEEVRRIEATPDLSPAESRKQIRLTVEEHYTLPA